MLTVSVPPHIQRILCKALQDAGANECGGVLMGEHIGTDHFVVRNITVQHTGTFASFVRGTRSAIKALRLFFQTSEHDYTRFNYLGEWHSHPNFSVEPSNTDHRSMIEIVTNNKVGANFVVLLIFKLIDCDELDGSAHMYVSDGTFAAATLDLASAT